MGPRRRAEEERAWGILVAQLLRQFPTASLLLAHRICIQAQMAGCDIMRACGRIVDTLRLLTAGLVSVFVVVVLGNGSATVQKLLAGVVFGLAASLVLVNTPLSRLDLHVRALAAKDIQHTGRSIIPIASLIVIGQAYFTLYPLLVWALRLTGTQMPGVVYSPLMLGQFIGSLPAFPLVISIAVRLPRQVQNAVDRRLHTVLQTNQTRQMEN